VIEPILRKVADGETGWFDDAATVGLVEPRQHLQQRRLAGAVGAAQADAFAVVDLPAHGVEQHSIAEGLAERCQLNHE
jgi:hypothetical protein